MKAADFWLHSSDPHEPLCRIFIEADGLLVTLYEASMTSASPKAQVLEYHDRVIMTPEQARWLRDALNKMDLEDDEPEDAVVQP